jgi:hypothetical protein
MRLGLQNRQRGEGRQVSGAAGADCGDHVMMVDVWHDFVAGGTPHIHEGT